MGLCGSKSTVPNADPRKDWEKGVPVYVNVYDLQSMRGPSGGAAPINGAMGLGAYHSGVQVFNAEYSFGGDPTGANLNQCGLFAVAPKTALPESQFHKQHLVGHLPASVRQQQVNAFINAMRPDWPMSKYHIVRQNCNHFSEKLLWALDEEFNLKPAAEQHERAAAEHRRVNPNAKPLPKHKPVERTLFLPAYINRAARFGAYVAPNSVIKALTRSAPPGDSSDVNAAAGSGGGASSSAPPPPPPPAGASAAAGAPPRDGSTTTGGGGASGASAPSGPSKEELRKQFPLPNDRAALEHMNTKALRKAMTAHNVDTTGCVEKAEFIDAVLRRHADLGTPAGGNM